RPRALDRTHAETGDGRAGRHRRDRRADRPRDADDLRLPPERQATGARLRADRRPRLETQDDRAVGPRTQPQIGSQRGYARRVAREQDRRRVSGASVIQPKEERMSTTASTVTIIGANAALLFAALGLQTLWITRSLDQIYRRLDRLEKR